MAGNHSDLIRRYLEDMITVEKSFETQLREFSSAGDDDDVKQTFADHAEETRTQYERLGAALQRLGGNAGKGKTLLARAFALTPKSPQIPHIEEERIVQNLVVAYTVEAAECGLYEGLATIAEAGGERETAALARAIQAEEKRAAETIWRFIPTRSIIAYNMLTAGEIDPAVETKVGEASWIA